jgi:hypothetical protein
MVVVKNQIARSNNLKVYATHGSSTASDQSLLHVANYPAGAAFFISAYKIYAVYPAKRYKSNIYLGMAWRPARYGAA